MSQEWYYLISAELMENGVKLNFVDSTSTHREVVDRSFRPYFFIPHPVSQQDQEALDAVNATITREQKTNLFNNHTMQVTKVAVDPSTDLLGASQRFERSWEGDIPPVLSYVYDHDLTFGALHRVHGDLVTPVDHIADEARQKFEERFSDIKRVDPVKYSLSRRWFTRCSQPVPQVSPENLNLNNNVDSQRVYLAFMLSRVANLPVPQAYTSHQVSTWLKSILHNHLRRTNLLIPTSRELRKGETKKRVRGALTFPPEPGVHFNTVVTDFESLYPSLIDAYNLSHETIDCSHEVCERTKVPGLNHHVCTQRRGVYSVLIGALKDLRIHWFKPLAQDETTSPGDRRLAQATTQLLKLILVSSYGVTVRMRGLARPSLAEAITAYGRHSLQTTWNIAEEGGLHPIYGDTDSLFLDNPKEKQVTWLINTVKDRLYLDLAVEARYAVCVLPKAMKAYFGVRRDGTADIKGVTAVKSNAPPVIQRVFRDCVKEMAVVTNHNTFAEAKTRMQRIVDAAIHDLTTGNVRLEDLEYAVELHEDPRKKMRDKAIHQPYQCAIQLIDAGQPVQRSDLVTFVKVKPFTYRDRTFTVKPTTHVKAMDEVNVEDYVRNLRTALNQTFKPMDLQFSDEAQGRVTLADFLGDRSKHS